MPHNDTSEVLLLLGSLNGKMDLVIKQSDEHGDRLTSLETWKNRIIGIALGSGAIAGGVASKLAPLIGSLPVAH